MGVIEYFYSSISESDTVGNSGGLSSTATSVIAGSLAPVGYPVSYPFKLRLEPGTPSEELVKIVSGSGTPPDPWIVGQSVTGGASSFGRGWDGTLAAPHAQGSPLAHGMSQEDLALSRAHEALDNTTALPHNLPPSAWGASAISLIQSTVLSSARSSITWNSIPQSFTHLLMVVLGKTTDTGIRDSGVVVNFNGDSAARYSTSSAFWTDGTIGGGGSLTDSQNSMQPVVVASSASGSPNAGGGVVFIPGYAGNTFNKAAFGFSGMGQGTSSANASMRLRACFFNPASQVGITSISLAPSGGQFKAGSVFSLYGLI